MVKQELFCYSAHFLFNELRVLIIYGTALLNVVLYFHESGIPGYGLVFVAYHSLQILYYLHSYLSTFIATQRACLVGAARQRHQASDFSCLGSDPPAWACTLRPGRQPNTHKLLSSILLIINLGHKLYLIGWPLQSVFILSLIIWFTDSDTGTRIILSNSFFFWKTWWIRVGSVLGSLNSQLGYKQTSWTHK